jgi:hypothetical protein
MSELSYLLRDRARTLGSPTTRVKVFHFREPDSVEQVINEWLSREKIIIRHITQSQSEKQGWFLLVVSVFYDLPS